MDTQRVLDIFQQITTIPRESGHEAPMTEFLQRFALEHDLKCKTDETGNVLITREASQGYESRPTIVLQSHQDMVCEKTAESTHNFLTDPIEYVIKDGWMVAEQTTLGADDGIGVAASLALLESDLQMGRVEALFTISEETGMDGAEALQGGFFTGKTLINLDSEDEGQLFIGCAGGVNTEATCHGTLIDVPSRYKETLKLTLSGTLGGHSGDDINKGRINAVQQLARFLHSAKGWRLVSLVGGGKPNAIARNCEAVVVATNPRKIRRDFEAFGQTLLSEYCTSDPISKVSVETLEEPATKSFNEAFSRKFIAALWACPHGVYAMDQDIKGLVETSNNLASVRMPSEDTLVVRLSERSSVGSAREAIKDRVQAHWEMIGASVEHMLPYPSWRPNMNSHILKVCVDTYRELFNEEPLVLAIHAGLECGLFLEKFPDLDMISFGPTLRGVHAPGERLELASMDRFVKLLTAVVCQFR